MHAPLPRPRPGDWLAEHAEPGQTYREYLAAKPFRPGEGRRDLVIQPIGKFSPAQRRVVDLTGEAMGIYFNLPVTFEDTLPLSHIPEYARRAHPDWGGKQVLTGYILNHILKARFPEDAVVFIAFTASDLWPGRGWNFVFGEASLHDRVAVWSLHRLGSPDKGLAAFRETLLRSIKVGTHETGHMFGMLHCTAFACNMCGSNSLEESDRQPLWLCPQCAAKVWWLTEGDPAARYGELAGFCAREGLARERAFFAESIRALHRAQ